MLIGVSCLFDSVRGIELEASLTIRDGKAVAKLTDDDHPEKEKLVLAQKKIKEVNDQINNNKRAAERKDAVFFIDKRLQEKPGSLVRPSLSLFSFFLLRSHLPLSRSFSKMVVS